MTLGYPGQKWPVTLFRNKFDRQGVGRALPWSGLVDLLTRWRETSADESRDDLPLWSPCSYRDGATRGKAGVDTVSCLALDFDDGTPIGVLRHVFDGYAAIVHTSWSHEVAKGDEAPVERFRWVFPLCTYVDAALWPYVWEWFSRGWRLMVAGTEHTEHAPDRACKDASRMYFLPALRPNQNRIADVIEGEILSVDWRAVVAIRAERLAAANRPPPVRPSSVPQSQVKREIVERLRVDPAARLELGKRLGGHHVPGRDVVAGVACPDCGRSEVWWPVHPEKMSGCACAHKKSCGWTGSLVQIAIAHGMVWQ